MSTAKNRCWFVLRLIAYALILLLGAAVTLPSFVKSRWGSSGVPVGFKFTVVEAQAGRPVPGARVLVWVFADEHWSINEGRVGDTSATTDANGTCEVNSYFPGSGSGENGRLRVNSTIWVRADGYGPWQKPTSALLGEHITIQHPFSQTNWYPIKILLTMKGGDPYPSSGDHGAVDRRNESP